MKKTIIPVRFFLVLLTFLLSVLLYIDRACISAAKNSITESLGFTDKQMGWILSAFALGYALFQTPSGILVDRFGARKILTSIVTLWSAFTALTGIAWNFISMLVVRFLFGMSEAGAFPGMARVSFSWFPIKERGVVTGINFSGSRFGAALIFPVLAILIANMGWKATFFILGGIGLIWTIIWFLLFKDEPTASNLVSESEKEYILKNRQQVDDSGKKEKLSASVVLKSKNMWMAMLQYFGSNFTFFFCLTWLFPHLQTKYDLEMVEAGWYAAIPLFAGGAGNLLSGILVDIIYRNGNWKGSRRIPAITGFFLVIVGLIGSLQMTSAMGDVIFLSIAIFGADMTLSPSWSFCVDIGKKNSGAISGTMNMAGNIGSFITALAFPYLMAWTGSENTFFYVGAGLALISIFAWLSMNPEKSIAD